MIFAGCSGKMSEIKNAFKNYRGRYVLSVSAGDFSLEVFDRNLKSMARYRVALGLNHDGRPKIHAGDNRTPVGMYYVTEILSMDAEKTSGSYKKLCAMNKIFFRARDGHFRHGHPDIDLGENAYGPRFYALDYPNARDRKRYEVLIREKKIPTVKGKIPGAGQGIAIHGNNDEDSIGHPATSGCIRMYNSDIIELEKYVQIGIPVLIFSD